MRSHLHSTRRFPLRSTELALLLSYLFLPLLALVASTTRQLERLLLEDAQAQREAA